MGAGVPAAPGRSGSCPGQAPRRQAPPRCPRRRRPREPRRPPAGRPPPRPPRPCRPLGRRRARRPARSCAWGGRRPRPGGRARRRPAGRPAGCATTRRPAAPTATSSGSTPAERRARRMASIESDSAGRIIALELGPGEPDLGLDVRAAGPGWWRRCRWTAPPWRRRTPGAGGPPRPAPPGSSSSSSSSVPSRLRATWAKTAASKSMPPRRSMPSGSPRISNACVRLAQHGGVERAAAEVVDGDDLARLHPLLAGVVDGRRLGLGEEGGVGEVGQVHGLGAAGPACTGPSWPGGRPRAWLGRPALARG